MSCTTGQLYYQDAQGRKKLACDVEFVGLPSVDKYAVEYALSLCAKSVVNKGGVIEETYLLDIDTRIPDAPCGQQWSHEVAKSHYKQGILAKKEYGYIVAHIDMGLAKVNQCTG
ncbi:hypothetical protein DXX93_15405 [Thalassotalea euphylliae]|uniref:Uncharacterized protein n=2 Tax=Thalassotalea euphylliae TaxID=1655234 RepID=A0A3E0TX00_9GAMM|nr:hypothetical protein DXX93_15405 [Thalassotalea euphylliae]